MKKYAATIYVSEEKIAKCFIEARPGVDHNTTRARTSLSGANERTTTAVIIDALRAKSELEKKKAKRKIKMELVITSATGKLQACTLCSYKRMLGHSYEKGATQQRETNNRLTMNNSSNSQGGLCCKSWVQTAAAVLVVLLS